MEQARLSPVRRGLIVVAIMFAVIAAIVVALKTGQISYELATRLQLAAAGILLVFEGNVIPKVLEPLTQSACAPSRMQALKRLAGYANVVGGLGFTLSWLILPFHTSAIASMSVLGGAWLIVLCIYVFGRTGSN